jgi:hypothetical protein
MLSGLVGLCALKQMRVLFIAILNYVDINSEFLKEKVSCFRIKVQFAWQ